MKTIEHWIGGASAPGSSTRTAEVYNPATGQVQARVLLAGTADVDQAVQTAKKAYAAWQDVSLTRRARDHVRVPEPGRTARRRPGPAGIRRARQGDLGRQGRGDPRPGSGRVRLRDPATAEGRVLRPGVHRRRRVLLPPAARRVRGDHPVQLPGHGADVDAPDGHRHWEHVRTEAQRTGPVGVHARRRAVRGGGPAGRRLQRGARGQGRGGRAARPPGRGRDLLRRLDPDRFLRAPARLRAGQAGPGARRGEEPRRGAARRRPGLRGRPDHLGRVRLGRRAVHGDLRRRRRGHGRGRARRAAAGRGGRHHGRPGRRRGQRHGADRHPAGPGPDRRLRQPRRAGRRHPGGGRPRPGGGRARGRLFHRPQPVRPRGDGHGHLHRRDLRAGPGRAAGRLAGPGDRADQRQPVRQWHGRVHLQRARRAHLPAVRARGHDRRQRPDPRSDGLLFLRRLEGLPVRRHPRARRGRHPVLHPGQGHHDPLARPRRTPASTRPTCTSPPRSDRAPASPREGDET